MMRPKTAKRRSAFRRANRAMPRRRIDIAIEAIDYKNPDLLKNSSRERQNPSPPRHRHAGASASQNHTRDQAQPLGAVDEIVTHLAPCIAAACCAHRSPSATVSVRPMRRLRLMRLTLVEFFRLARSASRIRAFRPAGRLRIQAVCFGKENRETCSCVRRDGP